MVVGLFIHSFYCPNCELFKYGSVIRYIGDEMFVFEGQGEGVESAYEIIREVCTPVGIPIIDADISQILGWGEDEYNSLSIPEVSRHGFRRKFLSSSALRDAISRWVDKSVIELPSFLIKSHIARDRYVNLEQRLDDPLISLDWQAARQVLREIARTAIEERLRLFNMYSYEMQETLLARLFPINETGKPNVIRWIQGFNLLNHIRFNLRR